MYDVVVIGAGVTGCAVARELSAYQLKTMVLEREEDVCCGTSKANSAIVHAGFDAAPGSWKARMNVEGNRKIRQLSKELDFPYKQNGSLVLCFEEQDLPNLYELKERGEKNGVEGLEIITGQRIWEMEPNLSKEVKAMLYAPTGGIVCPFKMTIALAENANVNGVEFAFDTCVENIEKTEKGYGITTNNGRYETRCIVNAAGVYADVFNNMVSERKLSITPRRGEYRLMDKKAGGFVEHTIFQLPTAMGKGVLITPTVHGNLLAGPTAEDIEDKEGVQTTAFGLDKLSSQAKKSAEEVPLFLTITSFAGLRATERGGDFVLGEAEDAKGFFNAAGIESPGLSSAPAIGLYLAHAIAEKLHAEKKENFISTRKDIPCIAESSPEELRRLIAENPAYGNVICRCETVTEGEIVNAIHRPLGARSLDGIKRRTRAGMGRCQSGFCAPKTMEILERELRKSPLEITKAGGSSRLLAGLDKGEEDL
ncbi:MULTISPECIES: NAD(P)/FAD-dependent oxidoreductase [Blautia]|uniref:NAD(P)/FAD-dependent oxidoreductase n=1 Tax=Blautia TaxID=572511 RepID=UPI00258FA348|nr:MULTISPECIES: NAD(P)/FAD-dependent oxidoreductase [Blautia]